MIQGAIQEVQKAYREELAHTKAEVQEAYREELAHTKENVEALYSTQLNATMKTFNDELKNTVDGTMKTFNKELKSTVDAIVARNLTIATTIIVLLSTIYYFQGGIVAVSQDLNGATAVQVYKAVTAGLSTITLISGIAFLSWRTGERWIQIAIVVMMFFALLTVVGLVLPLVLNT